MLAAAALCLLPVLAAAEPPPAETRAAARLSAAPKATEYWDVTARFDGGYRLFARFGITNEGPGEHTAGAIWYLVHPSGRVSEFRNGRTWGRWKLSPDRLRIDVASSSLDLHGPVRRLALDTTSQGGKITLAFPATAPEAPTGPVAPLGMEVLALAAPIDGTLWVRGMAAPVAARGTAALTHAWVGETIPSVVRRRIEFVAGAPDLAVYFSNVTAPAGAQHSWLAVEPGQAAGYQGGELALTIEPPAPASASRKYPVPDRLVLRNDRVTLTIDPERVLVRTNPLDAVPQPFRFLFSLAVDPRFVWAEASFRLTLDSGGDAPYEAHGHGTLVLSYLNPLPLAD